MKNGTFIQINSILREEWDVWTCFLKQNDGAPWKSMINIWMNADVALDASGSTFAGVVKRQHMPDMIVVGKFVGQMLSQKIQVKEGEALRQTLCTMVNTTPNQIKGKTVLCKVENQALKAIIVKKGSTRMLPLRRKGLQGCCP